MDAVMGLLVVLLLISTSITLVELSKQKSTIVLTRQARDVIDFNYLTGNDPVGIKTSCAIADNVASMNAYEYDSITKSVEEINVKVCE